MTTKAPPYPVGCRHERVAQPWDVKRSPEFFVLREPGSSEYKAIARSSAVKVFAPECKTLSRALDIHIPGAARQPAKLRSEDFPLGLPDLSPHNQRRVEVGNRMFEESIGLAEEADEEGQGFLVENPSAATDGDSRGRSDSRRARASSSFVAATA